MFQKVPCVKQIFTKITIERIMKKSCKIESFSQVKSSSTTPMHSRIGKSRDSVNPPVVISETKEHLNSPETSYLGYEMVHSFA
jgi:hypothetical protein